MVKKTTQLGRLAVKIRFFEMAPARPCLASLAHPRPIAAQLWLPCPARSSVQGSCILALVRPALPQDVLHPEVLRPGVLHVCFARC